MPDRRKPSADRAKLVYSLGSMLQQKQQLVLSIFGVAIRKNSYSNQI